MRLFYVTILKNMQPYIPPTVNVEDLPPPLSKRQLKEQKKEEDRVARENKDQLNFTGKAKRVGAEEDPPEIHVPGQQWFVISYVGPTGNQRSKNVCIKIRGGFPTDIDAYNHVKEVNKVDPDFDIHVVKGYNWLQIPPPYEHQQSIPMKYNQDKMDKFMEGYYSQQKAANAQVEARMRDAKKQAAKKNKHLREAHVQSDK